jgi:translation initiation factor IF-2
MTKVKLKDATKELSKDAGGVLEEATRVKRSAEGLLQTLRKLENQFIREEEQRRAQEKLEEQQKLAEQHTKAWTMLDEEEAAALQTEAHVTPAVPEKAEKVQAPVAPPAPPVVEAPAPEKAPAIEKVPVIEKAPVVEAKPVEAPKAAAKPVEAPKAAAEQAEVPVPESKATPVLATPDAAPAPDAAPVQAPAAAPAMAPAKPVPASPDAPAAPRPQAQPAARPLRPAIQPPRPMGQPVPAAQTNAPAAPVSGGAPRPPYGRPVNPVPAGQGPYGRPANPTPMGQGPYGRPANPAPAGQGPYGRPANPTPMGQGPYGRPVNPAPMGQGPYGRPVGSAPMAPGAPRPQGGFGAPRPQGGFGAPRPQGGFGAPRPQGGGFGAPRPGMGPRPGGAGGFGRPKAPELTPVVEKERVSNYDPNKKNYVRQHDPERVVKNRKQMVKENFSGYDDDVMRGGRKRGKKLSAQQLMAPIKIEKAFMTAENITVKDLTERIGKPAGDILKKLLLLGIMANINSELDFDTASLVCTEFGVELEKKLDKTAEDYLSDEDFEDTDEDLITRPPVITIMGHVDHGKTSLLDYIRNAHVTAGEAGGITQHIGAYTVELNDRQITFLDTPGHEAFTAMRARGAEATDIAVLVVAADDGVMPQTVEAINHAKAAGVPIIVAINKMDKPGADPDRVKQDLTAYELVAEEWGGETVMVPVSAVTGQGVDQLLEMILLVADVQQLRANPDRLARGVIIEAKLDKARGPVATVLVQNGTLHVGDNIVAGTASGRVRSMLNERGERVDEAGPSKPVEVSGFNEVPLAGDDMMAVGDDHLSRQVAEERREKVRAARASTNAKVTLDNLFSKIDAGKVTHLNLIIKADVQGSVEAVKQALEKLSNDEVKVRVLHSGVGAINKDDVNLANAFDAIIIGFNIRPDNSARDLAEREEIDIRLYRIIYQAIEDIEKAMKGLLAPQFKEVLLGHAEVRNVFKITGAGTIAGCYVLDGKMQRNASVRLLRDHVVVFEGKLSSLKRFKDDAKDVAAGYECGIGLEAYNDIKESDVIECFIQEEVVR